MKSHVGQYLDSFVEKDMPAFKTYVVCIRELRKSVLGPRSCDLGERSGPDGVVQSSSGSLGQHLVCVSCMV